MKSRQNGVTEKLINMNEEKQGKVYAGTDFIQWNAAGCWTSWHLQNTNVESIIRAMKNIHKNISCLQNRENQHL